MNLLFTEDTIYDIPDALELDASKSGMQLVICRKSDLENGGKEKLSEILNAINWQADRNVELLELDQKQSVRLASGLIKNDTKRVVISFGLSPMELGLQTPLQYYTPFIYENAIVIFSHPVQELLVNKKHKSDLWNAIKNFKA